MCSTFSFTKSQRFICNLCEVQVHFFSPTCQVTQFFYSYLFVPILLIFFVLFRPNSIKGLSWSLLIWKYYFFVAFFLNKLYWFSFSLLSFFQHLIAVTAKTLKYQCLVFKMTWDIQTRESCRNYFEICCMLNIQRNLLRRRSIHFQLLILNRLSISFYSRKDGVTWVYRRTQSWWIT